jgi:aconitate hydratase
MWDREGADKEERNTIVHSFNRNFSKELTGLIRWLLGSPELVTALAIAGDLSFNPLTDTLINGDEVKLDAPSGDELPPKDLMLILDFKHQLQTVQIQVSVSDTSERLQLLAPFLPWDGKKYFGS